MVPTPNQPEYPAAHGCASGAVMEAVRSFYDTRRIKFTVNSVIASTVPHAFESTDDVVKEVMNLDSSVSHLVRRQEPAWVWAARPVFGRR